MERGAEPDVAPGCSQPQGLPLRNNPSTHWAIQERRRRIRALYTCLERDAREEARPPARAQRSANKVNHTVVSSSAPNTPTALVAVLCQAALGSTPVELGAGILNSLFKRRRAGTPLPGVCPQIRLVVRAGYRANQPLGRAGASRNKDHPELEC